MAIESQVSASSFQIREVPLAILDIESTGFYTADLKHQILELSVIRREPGGSFYVAFDSLFSLEKKSLGATHIHQIRAQDLRGAPKFEEASEQIAQALSGAVWVAYNAYFDRNFVTAYLEKCLGVPCVPPFLCAQRLRSILKLGKTCQLKQACHDFSVPFTRGQHVALYDTWATAQLTQVWLDRMEYLGIDTLGDLKKLSPKSKFIDSLDYPLWYYSPVSTSRVQLKSRYALDRGLPFDAYPLPLPSDSLASEVKKYQEAKLEWKAPSEVLDKQKILKPKTPKPSEKQSESTSGFALRPYQLDAIHAIVQRRKAGIKKQVVCLPTGAGKTVIFSELARRAQRRVLILAHREELLTQAKEKLERALERTPSSQDHVRVDIEQAMQKAASDAKVVVASLRSLRADRLTRLLSDEAFGLIIYDECHHAVAEDNQRILESLGVFKKDFEGTLVGFTATTRRADGIGLDEVFDEVVYSRSLLDMLKDQYLVPVRGYRIDTSVSLEGIGGRGDFIVDELADRIDIQERNGLVARTIQELARDRRTICFCVTVSHAKQLAETLRRLNVPAATIHGEMKGAERSAVLKDFRDGALQVLTNVGVLTEGFDDPEVSCVAMARPTKSEALYVQCVGRGMRLASGKKDCIVLDFVDLSAMNLVTLPSLVGAPVDLDFEGRELLEGAEAYHKIFQEQPGFEWEAQRLSLSELQLRARAFDPLKLKLPTEVRAISQNGWVSLGQRGVALHFFGHKQNLNELMIWQTNEPGSRRYSVLLNEQEVIRVKSVEEGVEAADFEIGRMGHFAVESAQYDATWRPVPPTFELLEYLKDSGLPCQPSTLEEYFRAQTYLKVYSKDFKIKYS